MSDAGLLHVPLSWMREQVGLEGRRRVHTDGDHAFIEVGGVGDPRAVQLRERLKLALERLPSVEWAEVNAITRRVAVGVERPLGPVTELVRVVGDVEADFGVADGVTGRFEHPGDAEPARRALAEALGDVAGLGLAAAVAAARLRPAPLELASLVSAIESQPRLRRAVEQAIGRQNTELGLAWLSAFAHGVAQGPAGLVVDLVYRASLLTEVQARRRAWLRREPEFYANPRRRPVEPPPLAPRPVPLPRGTVGAWSDRLSAGALTGFAGTLLATGDARRAADIFLSGTPKAARLGREGFATQLGRTLSARGVVPVEPRALRRLDRVDTVVVDTTAVTAGAWRVDDVVALAGGVQPAPIVARLFAESDPFTVRSDGPWWLGPRDAVYGDLPQEIVRRVRKLGKGGARALVLTENGRPQAVVRIVARLDPGGEALAAAIRSAGHRLVVAGRKGAVAEQMGADEVCGRGSRLGAAVRGLQAQGAVVAVITRRGRAGLAAADVGIGLLRSSGRPPWGADVLCGQDLDDAIFLVNASVVARAVSARSGWVALAGSGAGVAAALAGPPVGAMERSSLAINGAALFSLAAGTQSARSFAARHASPADGAPGPAEERVAPARPAVRALPVLSGRLAVSGVAAAAALTAVTLRRGEAALDAAARAVSPG